MWASSCASALRKFLEPVSRWFAIIGGICVIGILCLVVSDITMRNTLNIALPAAVELVSLLMIIVMFSALAFTELSKKHVRVDILIDKFSPTAKLVFTMSGELLVCGIGAVLGWQIAIEAGRLMAEQARSGLMSIPLWTFAAASSLFFGFLGLATLTSFLESLNNLIARGTKNYLWLTPGVLITLAIFGMTFWPDVLLPFEFSATVWGAIVLIVLFALIFSGVHIGGAMAITTLLGMAYLITPKAGLTLLAMVTQTVASTYTWSVAPMFILMGLIVSVGRLGRDIYTTAYRWLGQLPGGIASATIAACAALAALVGDSLTGILTMSPIALPEMRERGYDSKLASGAICAGSTIGILIPPSLGFIVYGIMVEESVGRLFIAGILPGILMTIMLILLTSARCYFNPALGPSGPSTTFRGKVTSLGYSWSVVLLFLVVIGGIYTGIFTPTEAGAIGAFGAIVIAAAMRRLTFRAVADSIVTTTRTVALIFFIFVFAIALSQFLAATKLTDALALWVTGFDAPPMATLISILVFYLVIGCLMNALPALIVTLPVIYPVVFALGFDPIWFGVLLVVMCEIAVLTPPIGINVFGMSGIVDVPMGDIFKGVVPYWLTMLVVVAILVAFPQISLFLPNLMMGK